MLPSTPFANEWGALVSHTQEVMPPRAPRLPACGGLQPPMGVHVGCPLPGRGFGVGTGCPVVEPLTLPPPGSRQGGVL